MESLITFLTENPWHAGERMGFFLCLSTNGIWSLGASGDRGCF
jgi:hypothetical protein